MFLRQKSGAKNEQISNGFAATSSDWSGKTSCRWKGSPIWARIPLVIYGIDRTVFTFHWHPCICSRSQRMQYRISSLLAGHGCDSRIAVRSRLARRAKNIRSWRQLFLYISHTVFHHPFGQTYCIFAESKTPQVPKILP